MLDLVKTEENKMEIKDIKPANLAEAKRHVEEQRMNAEIEYAVDKYRDLTNEKDKLEREIKTRNEALTELNKELKLFKTKK